MPVIGQVLVNGEAEEAQAGDSYQSVIQDYP